MFWVWVTVRFQRSYGVPAELAVKQEVHISQTLNLILLPEDTS